MSTYNDTLPAALDVPVVFLIFNRPDVTRRVFAEIARQRPKQLFIVSDGARPHREGEAARVAETRAITDAIDWHCEVQRNYAEVNMGCKLRVASGINWVFSLVDRAIFIEDDCLPSEAFFGFCRDMLVRYADEPRVFAVSGSFFGVETGAPGHYFSRYALMWGWATWRSRWQHYQIQPKDHRSVLLKTWWRRPVVLTYWLQVSRRVVLGALDTWDVQWILTVWRHRALACRPNRNLVENLGFGADATHTANSQSELSRLRRSTDTKDLQNCLTPMTADTLRDSVDERRWALINVRSVLLMAFPILARVRAVLR
ncbi:MAG: glycosyltransferase family 2 protein [Aquabacterium sp.]|nr:glycosyltransferase family 2 protein [Aquabacterium sp.]